jgi:hypothetical protein
MMYVSDHCAAVLYAEACAAFGAARLAGLLGDADALARLLERWQHEIEQEHTPLLVIVYHSGGEILLSLMYLAQTDGFLVPSSEVKGLVLLVREEIQWLFHEPITLEQYLGHGGKALLNNDFDKNLLLEPFIQPRLLSRILLDERNC